MDSDSASGTTTTHAIETARWLQVRAQYMQHDDLRIDGNRSALLALADALRRAADCDAVTLEGVFAGDGEGYTIDIRHKERPSDFPDPTYLYEFNHPRTA